ncbi:MAG: SDR family NAD(P)-dependent oxidoreductase [Candidatus Heimdallarchaeota archaeon]
MKDLNNRNCLITGAANGIGKSFALALAREGMNLFITDIDIEKLEKVKNDIKNIGAQVYSAKCDVTKIKDFQDTAKQFNSKLGELDLLINNAGIVIGGNIFEITLDDWKDLLDVNLWSIIHSLKVFLPKMVSQSHGHIVNVASAAGVIGATEPLPYIASKFAVVGLSEALFGQLSSYGINVSVVLPLYVRTNIFESCKIKHSQELIDDVGEEKLREISKSLLKDMQSKSILPDRAVKKYIQGIKNNQLYIYDSKAVLSILTLKGTNQPHFEQVLKDLNKSYEEIQRKHYLKYGINIDDYR